MSGATWQFDLPSALIGVVSLPLWLCVLAFVDRTIVRVDDWRYNRLVQREREARMENWRKYTSAVVRLERMRGAAPTAASPTRPDAGRTAIGG